MVWFLAALIDLSMVAFFGRQHELIHYDHNHLMERYGLFVLIAVGESIVDLSLPLARQATEIRPGELVAVAVCFVVICLLWWTYFDHANAAITQALAGVREHVVHLDGTWPTGTSASSAGSSASPSGSRTWSVSPSRR